MSCVISTELNMTFHASRPSKTYYKSMLHTEHSSVMLHFETPGKYVLSLK